MEKIPKKNKLYKILSNFLSQVDKSLILANFSFISQLVILFLIRFFFLFSFGFSVFKKILEKNNSFFFGS